MTTVQPPVDTDQQGTFQGDRYERLVQAANIWAADEGLVAAELPYNSQGLLAFVADLVDRKLLDGLTESDANWAGVISILDFPRGPVRMAWRIWDMLSDEPATPNEWDDEIAGIHAYIGILHMLLGAFVITTDKEAER